MFIWTEAQFDDRLAMMRDAVINLECEKIDSEEKYEIDSSMYQSAKESQKS